jgi:predicted MFS family arabinose efflux permease
LSTATSREASDAVSLRLMVLALAPFAFGYFLSYLFRAANAVVAADLVAEIGLTASELGLLTAAYLFAFAVFQLPLGILLDRYGPRRVQAALMVLAAAGALLFASGRSVALLATARALIGLGFAGGLMSGFKAVVLWVPEPRRALANASVMSFGALGLLVATVPMEWGVQFAGWRAVFAALALITFLVAMLILILVPERTFAAAGGKLTDQMASVAAIFLDRAFLRLAPLVAATAGTHIAIQTLWAGPWFRDVAGLDRNGVASHLLAMAAAFFVGILSSGAVADWLVRRGTSMLTVMLGFLLLFLASQLVIVVDWPPLRLLAWLAFAMTGQAAILAYPWLANYFGAHLSGRAHTAINLLIFLTAFTAQSAIGVLIDLFPRTASGGYAPRAYQLAFGVFLALQVCALLWYLADRRLLAMRRNEEA